MKLGKRVSIITNTPDMDASLEFYKQLGYKALASGEEPSPWVQLSDGVILLLINQDEQPDRGLIYYADDMGERASQLEDEGLEFNHKREHDGYLQQVIFSDPNGLCVSLVQADHTIIPQPEGESYSKCGTFGEFSIPTQDLNASLAFWERLGFQRTGGDDAEPYPWAIVNDELITLGLHQTQDFNKFIITYFAADMAVRIESLRQKGLTFSWEHKDEQGLTTGARMESPGGQGFFLFQEEGW
jgi:predicted lactoylglutathione lyase